MTGPDPNDPFVKRSPQDQPPAYGGEPGYAPPGEPPRSEPPRYEQPQYGQPQYGAGYGQPGYGSGQYPPAPGYGGAQYPPAPGYGGGQYPPGYGGYPQPAQGNGLAVAGMVCGIVGLVLFWVPILGWILAILAIIFGAIGIAKANGGAPNKGMGITGVVLGIVSIGLYILIVAIVVGSVT